MLLTLVVLNTEVFQLYIIHVCILSRFSSVQLFATPWTIVCQASLSMELFRQEYWSGLPCLPPGDLPDSGMEPMPLVCSALAGGFFTSSSTWEAHTLYMHSFFKFLFHHGLSQHFLNWRIIAFSVILVSGVRHCESAISIHISLVEPHSVYTFLSVQFYFSLRSYFFVKIYTIYFTFCLFYLP